MSKTKINSKIAVIGYSGHGFVAIDILLENGYLVTGYCDREEKSLNPYSLEYLGQETGQVAMDWFAANGYFIAIGDNTIRERIQLHLIQKLLAPVSAIHPSAVISRTVEMGQGVMVAGGVVINALAKIGDGAICNTNCSVDHECEVGNFAHIGPGAVVCGNVQIGERSFIGAGSVIRQGIRIGKDVIIGAGAVVVKDVADGMVLVGGPLRELRK